MPAAWTLHLIWFCEAGNQGGASGFSTDGQIRSSETDIPFQWSLLTCRGSAQGYSFYKEACGKAQAAVPASASVGTFSQCCLKLKWFCVFTGI